MTRNMSWIHRKHFLTSASTLFKTIKESISVMVNTNNENRALLSIFIFLSPLLDKISIRTGQCFGSLDYVRQDKGKN